MGTYEDFEIRIVADGDSYKVLAQSGDSQAGTSLKLPECEGAPPEVVSPAGEVESPALKTEETEASLREIGTRLFDAILNGPVRSLFDRVNGSLRSSPDRRLRLRLHLDPRDARLRWLSRLPWEALFCTDTFGFLGLENGTLVVRSLDALQPVTAPPLASPLRILLVMANPPGTSPLSIIEERRTLERTLGHLAAVELHSLERATCVDLLSRLGEQDFSIVHFMGHGIFDEHSGQGALLFESAGGDADPISAEVFATLLRQRSGPALVVLNACRTAQASERIDAAPFTSVAAALIGKGIPAVLAMQSPISDPSALDLTEALYGRLAAGDSLEAAVACARFIMYAKSPDTLDWTIPILFQRPAVSRADNSEIHEEQRTEPAPPPQTPAGTSVPGIHNHGPIGNQFNTFGNPTINVGSDKPGTSRPEPNHG